MKYINRYVVAVFLISFCSACGGNKQDKDNGEANDVTQNEILEGKNLIAKSDCMGCHKEDGKLVGPSYLEIANYYEANEKNVELLAVKIVKGGQGAWGSIPMAPHPTVSEQDAQKMVKYILSLKK